MNVAPKLTFTPSVVNCPFIQLEKTSLSPIGATDITIVHPSTVDPSQ